MPSFNTAPHAEFKDSIGLNLPCLNQTYRPRPMSALLIPVRLASADILKAASIIAVVFIHAALIFPFSPNEVTLLSGDNKESLLTNYIALSLRFCVPVFIILWAYFLEISLQKNNESYYYLLKRFYLLLIPFFFWSVIYFIFIADFKTLTFVNLITKYWSGYGWSGQYFFIILFQLIPLLIIIRKFNYYIDKHIIPIIILSILFYTFVAHHAWFETGIASKIGDRLFIYWLPYVFIGIAYARKKITNSFSNPAFVVIIAICILIIPLESILSDYTHFTLFKMSDYVKPSVFIASIALVYLLLGNATTYQQLNPWLATGLGVVARNTLGIFCLNPLIIILISLLVRSTHTYISFPGASFITPFFSVALVISICIIIISLLKRMKLGVLISS